MPFLNKKFSAVRNKIVFSYFCTLFVLELATLTKKVIFKYFHLHQLPGKPNPTKILLIMMKQPSRTAKQSRPT